MREIKFRGKTKEGKWVYGYYYFSYNEHKIMTIADDDLNGERTLSYPVIPETVGQMIWKDENGNEFYSGDIIRQYNHDSDVYSEGELVFCDLQMQWELKDAGVQFYKYHNPKVTGNIHDKTEEQ